MLEGCNAAEIQAVMAAPAIHSKLLTQAARQTLRPLGLVQYGRSRTWIDDHGWWLINVEFQPSSFAKGSYLNVGVQWLWHQGVGLAFHFGHRVPDAGFVRFENPEQCAAEAQQLATRAAHAVTDYRVLFADLARVPVVLLKRGRGKNQQDAYHIAVACGLLGRLHDARLFFDAARIEKPFVEWHEAENERIRELSALLDDRLGFYERVKDIVAAQRRACRLDASRASELPFV